VLAEEAAKHFNIADPKIVRPLVVGTSRIRNLLTWKAQFPRYRWYEPWYEPPCVPLGSLLVEWDVVAAYAKEAGSNVTDLTPSKKNFHNFRFWCFETPYLPSLAKLIITGSMI